MKTQCIAIVILLFIVTACSAQKTDTAYVNSLNEKAWLLKDSSKTQAKKYAFEALELSKKIGYKKGEADSYSRLGVIYKNEAKYDSALMNHMKAAEIRNTFTNKKELAQTYDNIGNIYKNIDMYDSAILYISQSIQIKVSYNDLLGTIKPRINLGHVLEQMNEPRKALEYYQSALKIAIENESEEDIHSIYINIGNVYLMIDSLDTAITLYASNLDYYKDVDPQKYSGILSNIGICYQKLKNYTQAEKYFRQNLEMNNLLQIPKDIAESYSNLASLFLEKKDFKNSILYSNISLQISNSIDANLILISNFETIAISYASIGEYDSAYKYMNILTHYKDSIFNNEQKNKIALGLEARYKNVQQAQENKIISQQLENKSLQSHIYLISAISLASLLFIGSIIYFQQRRLNKKKAQIANQQIDELLNTQEIKSLNAMMEGQETERKRIAQDLHDRIGSLLSTVKLHFNSLENKVENYQTENKEQFTRLNTLLDEAVGEVRRISHNLVSGVLLQFGVVPALQELCDNIQAAGHFTVQFLAHGMENRLDTNTEISMYRIVQELLGNIMKHAQATEVTVQLTKHDHELTVLVEDNGKGYDTKKEYQGIGLKNIMSRVTKLNGTFSADSTIGKGTTSIATIQVT